MSAAATTKAACWACGGPAQPSARYAAAGLYRCTSCGLLFDTGRSLDELKALYDESYFDEYSEDGGYDDEDSRRFESRVRVNWVRRHGGRGRLLEIGSATGHFLQAAREAGFDVVGLEPAASAARKAAERLGVEVKVGFLEDAELPPAAFDSVAAWHVLEHVREPVNALALVRETLRPGGRLFLEVPNAGGIDARLEGMDWPALKPLHHVAQYGATSLRRLLERAGFEVVLIRSYEWTSYYPLRRYLSPYIVVRHHIPRSLRRRAVTIVPHPWRHDLLRAVARRVS